MHRSSNRWIPALLGLVLLAACQDDSRNPAASLPPGASEAGAGERPFYYYQGQPVYLDVDPEQIVVASDEQKPAEAARQVLSALGVGVEDAGTLTQARGHRVLRLAGGRPETVKRAAALLRADRRFSFASPAFRTVEGRNRVLLLNRVAVQFRERVTPAQVDSLNRTLGTRVVRLPKPDSGFFAYHLAYPAGADPLRIAQALDRSPLVEWADPDKVSDRQLFYTPTDPYYGLQFHLKNANYLNGVPVDINVEPVWNYTRGNGSLRVTVIDDGVDILHGNLGGGYTGDMHTGQWGGAQGYDVLWYSGIPDSGTQPCCNDTHGTSVAGIIAASQDNGIGGAGIAPSVIVNHVRIFRQTYPPQSYSGSQVASDAGIADGINWAWRWASSDVINNSWGGGAPSNAITTAIQNALSQGRGGKGTVVVFAAGNTSDRRNGWVGAVQYPATLSSTTNVISVGAINRTGGPANYTPNGTIDVVAPSGHDTGACVGEVVTIDRYGSPGCNDGPSGDINYTSTFSGTSAAAPQVSGVAALLLSYNGAWTAAQIKTKIRGGATYWGAATTYGAGKLNAYGALLY